MRTPETRNPPGRTAGFGKTQAFAGGLRNEAYHGEPSKRINGKANSRLPVRPSDVLLQRLDHVRSTGPDSWRANCPNPVHDHGRGSLAIRCGNDGVLLLHCFACGDVAGILSAVGLEVRDLFPERIKDPSPEGRRAARAAFKQSAWSAALSVLSREGTVVAAAAGMVRQHLPLSDADDARLALALQCIDNARAVLT